MPSEFQYQSWQMFQSQLSTWLPGWRGRRGTNVYRSFPTDSFHFDSWALGI